MDYATAQKAFGEIKGGTFVGMDTETVETLKGGKKNPFQGRLTKRMTGSTVMVFGNTESNAYENMVKRRLAKEGKDPEDFKLSPRAWGQRIPGTAFVEHKGEHYIEVIFLHAGDVEYFLDGKPIDLKVPPLGADNWLDIPERKVTPTGQGGLSEEKRVQIRTFKLDSILQVRIKGDTLD